MRRTRRTPGAALLPLLALALACGGGPEPETGRPPQRIIALAPSVVEILFALGLGERVVGIGDFSAWPPEAAAKPRLGGLHDPDLERIVALAPDLAVLASGQDDLGGDLRRLGIEVLAVPAETLADVEAAIAAIAERCAVPGAGAALLAEWRQALAPRAPAARPRVLLSLSREPGPPVEVMTSGPGTFYDDLLARLGAVNVFADAPGRYPRVGLEEILGRAPEAIVELRYEEASAAAAAALVADWQGLVELPAVRDGRIAVVAGSHTMLPGPRLPRLYRELGAALDPGAGPGVPAAPPPAAAAAARTDGG